ncbi:hypothetical protein CPB84DRAFT_1305124 [Gymnopilus junonius]|uniref:Uncharacterized protein n=1 Tax=Gymnopilus junonius TaxID=109634 RepID=A0A9P5NMM4_GYMJU|nr:hypothetical protein CPB84DRAFT_1305124 [Gymnopilus junonius]
MDSSTTSPEVSHPASRPSNATMRYFSTTTHMNSLPLVHSMERLAHGMSGLNVRNGPSISGPLNMRIDPGSSISGSGVWTQN